MAVATVYVKTQSKEHIPLSALIVPTIAVPLKISATSRIRTLPYLHELQLASTDGDFSISLLIGAEHCWDIVEDYIIREDSPTGTSSKISYLLFRTSFTYTLSQSGNKLHSCIHPGQ